MKSYSKIAVNGERVTDEKDIIDRMNAAWKRERPDLDSSPLETVGRAIVIAQYLERRVSAALEPLGLTLGQFDILATLRRQGPEGKMTPKQLMRNVMLSSGGMTNRLDRLEEAGLVAREDDPGDRRGVVVGLTPKGRERIDAATEVRFAEAKNSLPPFQGKELKTFAGQMRVWLNDLTRL